MREFFRHILAFFYPERCPYCSALIEPDEIACPKCHMTIVSKSVTIGRGVLGSRCVAPYAYEGRVRKAIVNFKFHEVTQHTRTLGAVLADTVKKEYDMESIDLITFVPMHEKDKYRRGYNQSELLAKELSRIFSVPCVPTLKKVKKTKKQHRLPYAERKKNLSGAFSLIGKEQIKGKNILLIDDVMTTGITLSQCVKKLYSAKPNQVFCAVLASASEHEKRERAGDTKSE